MMNGNSTSVINLRLQIPLIPSKGFSKSCREYWTTTIFVVPISFHSKYTFWIECLVSTRARLHLLIDWYRSCMRIKPELSGKTKQASECSGADRVRERSRGGLIVCTSTGVVGTWLVATVTWGWGPVGLTAISETFSFHSGHSTQKIYCWRNIKEYLPYRFCIFFFHHFFQTVAKMCFCRAFFPVFSSCTNVRGEDGFQTKWKKHCSWFITFEPSNFSKLGGLLFLDNWLYF